jgi:ankyrin repeat protein
VGCSGWVEVIVKLLLGSGKADPDFLDSDRRTPLSWAAANGNQLVVRSFLVEHHNHVGSEGPVDSPYVILRNNALLANVSCLSVMEP